MSLKSFAIFTLLLSLYSCKEIKYSKIELTQGNSEVLGDPSDEFLPEELVEDNFPAEIEEENVIDEITENPVEEPENDLEQPSQNEGETSSNNSGSEEEVASQDPEENVAPEIPSNIEIIEEEGSNEPPNFCANEKYDPTYEYREDLACPANEEGERKYLICKNLPNQGWLYIEVADPSLPAHANKGAYLVDCGLKDEVPNGRQISDYRCECL